MMMEATNNEFEILLQKYADGQLSKKEFDLLLSYVRDVAHTGIMDKVVDRDWADMGMDYPYSAVATEKLFENIKSDQRYCQGFEGLKNPAKVIQFLYWKRIAVVAAIIAIVFGGGIFYYNGQSSKTKKITAYANDVAPGKNGATLTLANGQKILVNEVLVGSIAEQSGVKISKTADGQIVYEISEHVLSEADVTGRVRYNTLSTSRGEQAQVRLPDGSVVFLNAASSLRYPTSFAKLKKRETMLSGEGYFEVSKDKAHPFIVYTVSLAGGNGGQKVEVLGTHFNINAYPDEGLVKTTLSEGSVKVAPIAENSNYAEVSPSQTLKPGQQSIMSHNRITIKEVDLAQALAWQKGYFSFYDENIESIMRKISRWYDIEVEYQGQISEKGFNARITKYSNIKDVLGILEKSKAVHFKIEGRKVIVSN